MKKFEIIFVLLVIVALFVGFKTVFPNRDTKTEQPAVETRHGMPAHRRISRF